MHPNQTLFEIIAQGGQVGYVLLGVSVIGLGFFLYCLFMLRRNVLFPKDLTEMAIGIRHEDEFPQAEALCRKVGGPLAEVLLTVLMSRRLGREEAETLVEGAGRRAAHSISIGVIALEVIAAIGPLMGLLGTVTGMYEVFGRISQTGASEMSSLSGGIAEAMITTIMGLSVAIPSYVAHVIFTRRIEDMTLEMERLAVGLMLRVRS